MKLYNIGMANYNKLAMNIGFSVLVVYILIKLYLLFSIFMEFSSKLYKLCFIFVALALFGGILPKIRGEVFLDNYSLISFFFYKN